jgi:CRISPR-associated protein Csc1
MSHDTQPAQAHVYRFELFLWEHTFFSSREIDAFFHTEPLIGNYALAYALGLAQSPYHVGVDTKSGKQPVSYKRDLSPLNDRGIYVTPATIVGEPKFALTQFNAQTDTYWSAFSQNSIVSRRDHERLKFNGQNWQQFDPVENRWKKSPQAKPVNFPQHGRIKMLALGNRAVGYIISQKPLENTLPVYIRLGKFMSKAAVTVTHRVSQPEWRVNQTVNGFLNPTDFPNTKELRLFDLVSIHPTPLIRHAQWSGWFYHAPDNEWLPAGMRFGVEGLP